MRYKCKACSSEFDSTEDSPRPPCPSCGSSDVHALVATSDGRSGEARTEKKPVGAMFAPEDYLPFMVGVFVLGGLLAIPLIWGFGMRMGFWAALPWGLVSALVWLVAFRRDGTLCWGRLIGAMIAVLVLGNVWVFQSGGSGFVVSGIGGILIILACGYAGIGIGRIATGRWQWHYESSYVATSVSACVLIMGIVATLAYRWARALPPTRDGIKPEEVPGWTIVLAVAGLVGLMSLAAAGAPRGILESKRMEWLLRFSGMKSTLGMRVIFVVFSLIGIGVMVGCFFIARG